MTETSSLIARVVETDPRDEVVAMATMALTLPRHYPVRALAVMAGLGEDERIASAVKDFNRSTSGRFLFIAGAHHSEKTYVALNPESLRSRPFGLFRKDGAIRILIYAENTKDQANWLADQIKECEVESVGLYVSPFHTLRAYLTLLASLKDRDVCIPVFPATVLKPPGKIIQEYAATGQNWNAWQLVPGEVKRILEYGAKGDLLNYKEFRAYVDWLWQMIGT